MLKLKFWEDEDKKEDGYQYHCCGVDDSEVEGTLSTWYREANYEIAKEKMLENLKRLRDDIDNLIKEEEKSDDLNQDFIQKGDNVKEKEYYLIQNKEGKFFKADNFSGGYPIFIDDFEFCDKYNSKQFAEDSLKSDYATRLFKKEFEGCVVRTVKMSLE